MKKKLLSVVISLLLVASCTACGDKENNNGNATEAPSISVTVPEKVPETSNTEVSDTSSETELEVPEIDEYEECQLIYLQVLKDCYNALYYNMQPLYEDIYPFLSETMYYDMDEKNKVGYCFEDIDGDGKSELIVGQGDRINVICSYDEDGPNVLIGVGYRSSAHIFENGNVMVEGSSGAFCYSYDMYTWDESSLVLNDFFYTDDPDFDGDLSYYHNTTGLWDIDSSEELTLDEFNVMTEIGLEERSFADKYVEFSYLEEAFGNRENVGIILSDLIGTTWEIDFVQLYDMYYDYDHDSVMQYIQFMDDGTVVYCHNDAGHEYTTNEVIVEEYEYLSQVVLSFEDIDGTPLTLTLVRIDENGRLVAQRMWFSETNTGEFTQNIINEYYGPTVG